MKRFVEEPLIHFLLLGAMLFGAYAWLDRGGQREIPAHQVRIGEGDVAWLKTTWTRQWQREPTRDELRGLVVDFVKEELLAREARAMRLDENDTIVRRRLAQKVEFIVQDVSRLAEPTEEELRRLHAAQAERFQTEPRVSFNHIFFSREKRSDASADATAALLGLSEIDADLARFGDRLMIDSELLDASARTVAALFGPDFAKAIFAFEPGVWRGPIESGYGVHLVLVSELKRAERREFAAVRLQVLEHWRDQRRREDNERYFAGLLKKYDVILDERVTMLVGTLMSRLADATRASGARE